MSELLIRDRAVRTCRALHPTVPDTAPCPVCLEAAKRAATQAERDAWTQLESGVA